MVTTWLRACPYFVSFQATAKNDSEESGTQETGLFLALNSLACLALLQSITQRLQKLLAEAATHTPWKLLKERN